MSIAKIDENDKIAWDYPYKGCLFDKMKQRFAECNREDVEGYQMLTGNVMPYLNRLNWKPIEQTKDSNL